MDAKPLKTHENVKKEESNKERKEKKEKKRKKSRLIKLHGNTDVTSDFPIN